MARSVLTPSSSKQYSPGRSKKSLIDKVSSFDKFSECSVASNGDSIATLSTIDESDCSTRTSQSSKTNISISSHSSSSSNMLATNNVELIFNVVPAPNNDSTQAVKNSHENAITTTKRTVKESASKSNQRPGPMGKSFSMRNLMQRDGAMDLRTLFGSQERKEKKQLKSSNSSVPDLLSSSSSTNMGQHKKNSLSFSSFPRFSSGNKAEKAALEKKSQTEATMLRDESGNLLKESDSSSPTPASLDRSSRRSTTDHIADNENIALSNSASSLSYSPSGRSKGQKLSTSDRTESTSPFVRDENDSFTSLNASTSSFSVKSKGGKSTRSSQDSVISKRSTSSRRGKMKVKKDLHSLLQREDSVNLTASKRNKKAMMATVNNLNKEKLKKELPEEGTLRNDEDSIAESTITRDQTNSVDTEDQASITSSSTSQRTPPRCKRVKFDCGENGVSIVDQPANTNFRQMCWYKNKEYMMFRAEIIQQVAQVHALSINDYDSSFPKAVAVIYETCCRDEWNKKTKKGAICDESKLNQQAEEDSSAINSIVGPVDASKWIVGLESIAVPYVQNETNIRRRRLTSILEEMQRRKGGYMVERRALSLARNLERATRPAQLFAQAVGKVVAKAAAPQVPSTKDTVARGEDNFEIVSSQPVKPRRRLSLHDQPACTDAVSVAGGNETAKPAESSPTSLANSIKKVSFLGISELSIMGVAANENSAAECWYTREDHQVFRKEANAEIEELALSKEEIDLRYKGVLNGVYLACCRAGQQAQKPKPPPTPSSQQLSLSFSESSRNSGTHVSPSSNASDERFTLADQDKNVLNGCLLESYDRLGLDMMALQCLREDNVHRRRYYKKRVLDIQRAFQELCTGADQCSESIRCAVEPLSLPSRLFAKELAASRYSFD